MPNGLYKVDFKTPLGQGAGVVQLADGKIHGGDSSMFYVGEYSLKDDDFRAEVQIATHTNVAGMGSVFGVPKGTIALEGKLIGDNGVLKGSSPQAPGITFSATLSKIAA